MEAMPNRLATSASLYLRQHADNPVDWFPWGDEAFAKALGEGKPVFLSVGYSSCHWCHVMAHESFEDDGVATILNEHFVSIKLDREERPDVDEAYMAAVQLATSRGGWPMTVFMTPEREPFFAGTYFPREDRGQSPGFVSIIKGISEGWKSNRKEFEEAASEFAASMRDVIAQAPPDSQSGLHSGLLLGAIGALHHDFDPRFAGFGGAPKFPPHTAIEFCLKFAGSDTAAEDRDLAMHMANATLMAMAAGGIRDHVGGGFHRYATDQTWGLPHFEKMLVDNALMLSNYALAARVTGNAGYKRVAEEIIEWLEREMKLDGLYCSALDADTEGEEGKTYTWTWKEIHALLGERAVPFMEAYGFAPNGNFDDEATGERTGGNIPMLEFAQAVQNVEFEAELRMLLAARLKRPQPARDDKAIVGHNGLLMAALAQAGRMDLAACLASRLSTFFVSNADVSLRIPRYIGWTKEPDSYSLSGYGVEPIEGNIHAEPHGDGFLEDYAGVAYGFTVLAELDPEGSWMDAARDLAQLMLQKFWNSSASAFFTTGEHQEVLFGRVRPIFDQPAPSATALAARALLRTGYLSEARQVLAGVAGWMERAPQATEALHTAYLELHSVKPISFPHDDGVQMWIEWQHYPRGGTMHFSIPAGWHISREALRITAKFPIKLLLLGMQGEGNWDVPFILNVPERWTGKVNMVVRWQICTDKECLPWAERQHQLVVS